MLGKCPWFSILVLQYWFTITRKLKSFEFFQIHTKISENRRSFKTIKDIFKKFPKLLQIFWNWIVVFLVSKL